MSEMPRLFGFWHTPLRDLLHLRWAHAFQTADVARPAASCYPPPPSMTSYWIDWLSLLLRWLHIVAGAAWIGASFYFNWLNNSLRPPTPSKPGIGGELWAIHGGHFYQVRKYTVAPDQLPSVLHWFKWEAYTTWMSGIALLTVVYYIDPKTYLIDPKVAALSPVAAIHGGLGMIIVGFLLYHFACKSPLGSRPTALAAVIAALLVGLAYLSTHLFGSRAAYVHVGATIGTIMAGNVFFVIIPNQRKMVDAMIKGQPPAAKDGIEASLRSLHNNYFTLPVLFIMVSNHYPFTFGHPYNWAVLAGLALIGVMVRHWFNLKGLDIHNTWLLPASAVAVVALAFVSAPKTTASKVTATWAQVKPIIDVRCRPCHSATPTQAGIAAPPQGVTYDSPEEVARMTPRIYQQAVVAKTMPLANITGMTDSERELVGAWIMSGAKME